MRAGLGIQFRFTLLKVIFPPSLPVRDGGHFLQFQSLFTGLHLVGIALTSIALPGTHQRQWHKLLFSQIFLPRRLLHRLIFQNSSSCLSRNMNVRTLFISCESFDGQLLMRSLQWTGPILSPWTCPNMTPQVANRDLPSN